MRYRDFAFISCLFLLKPDIFEVEFYSIKTPYATPRG